MSCCREARIYQALRKRGLTAQAATFREIVEGKGWSGLPKGWTKDSARKFWNSLTGDRKHKITACMKKMEGKIDNPGAFCGGLASYLGER